jgi:hypothetical protein
MSKCAVHMMKMKSSAMGGIQSHNQREHESTKNKDIDYEKSEQNFDLVNDEPINYQRAIKERIAELNLKKAVRKDAVTYCSFIVSSDRGFFEQLAWQEHIKRENDTRESVAIGVNEPAPFEYMPESYQEECFIEGSRNFFQSATDFFCERYGADNVINATVHMDEATPHMHLGLVPVTKDGRLSAKSIFTKVELQALQTAFAEQVGAKYGLERGIEGSEATHLSEERFKLKMAQDKAEEAKREAEKARQERYAEEAKKEQAVLDAQNARKTLLEVQGDINTLESKKEALEGKLDALEREKEIIEQAVKGKRDEGEKLFGISSMKERIEEARKQADRVNRLNLLEKFVALPQIKPIFEQFCKMLHRSHEKGRDITR